MISISSFVVLLKLSIAAHWVKIPILKVSILHMHNYVVQKVFTVVDIQYKHK